MKKLFYIFLFATIQLFAQQEQQYSQYMINQFVLNPAVAGTEDFIDLHVGFRNQWTGFESAPRTFYATGHATMGKKPHQYHRRGEHQTWHGVGFQAVHDQTGPIRRTSFLLAYAYNFPLTNKIRVSAGAFAGVKQVNFISRYWRNIDDESDQMFGRDISTGLTPDLHVGALVYSPEFFVNFAVYQLLNNRLSYDTQLQEEVLSGKLNNHFFMSGGIKTKLSEKVEFMPSIMMKYVKTAPLSVDLNVKITHNQKFWYGASYRVMDALNVFAGVELHYQFDISYAFEWSTTSIGKYISGTHEVILAMRLRHPKNIECPSKYW